MTETCCAEVDVNLARHNKVLTGGLIREKRKHEVLKEPTRVVEMHVYASCGVGGLLKENSITSDFADINGDFLFRERCQSCILPPPRHRIERDGKVILTFRWAANMQFIIGMY